MRKILIWFLFVIPIFIYIVWQFRTAIFLSHRERISVAVFDRIPYVLTYSKQTSLVNVIYFDPEIFVYVPGGYSWYQFKSLSLLARIEKNPFLYKTTYEELIGAPIDFFVYSKEDNLDFNDLNFESFFQKIRKENLFFSNKQIVSTKNLIDLYNLDRVFNSRFDKISFLNYRNDFLIKGNRKIYMGQKTDLNLKGFFYQDQFLSNNLKLRILSSKNNYFSAKRLGRIIEGMGIKVLSVEVSNDFKNNERCVFKSSGKGAIYSLIGNYLSCQYIFDKKQDFISTFYFSDQLGKIYK